MRTIVKGKNIEVPDRVRRYAERKLTRVERLLDDRTDAIVELSVEQHRSAADSHLVDVVDHKEKPRVRARPIEEKQILRRIADGTAEPLRERRIVKTKRFAIEPMFEEDAVSEMEDLGHSFFIFVNAETERLAVLYRRDDGDYGIIEPSIGGQYTSGRSTTDGRESRDLRDRRPGRRRSGVG